MKDTDPKIIIVRIGFALDRIRRKDEVAGVGRPTAFGVYVIHAGIGLHREVAVLHRPRHGLLIVDRVMDQRAAGHDDAIPVAAIVRLKDGPDKAELHRLRTDRQGDRFDGCRPDLVGEIAVRIEDHADQFLRVLPIATGACRIIQFIDLDDLVVFDQVGNDPRLDRHGEGDVADGDPVVVKIQKVARDPGDPDGLVDADVVVLDRHEVADPEKVLRRVSVHQGRDEQFRKGQGILHLRNGILCKVFFRLVFKFFFGHFDVRIRHVDVKDDVFVTDGDLEGVGRVGRDHKAGFVRELLDPERLRRVIVRHDVEFISGKVPGIEMDLRRKTFDQILRRAARIHVVQVEVHRGIDEVLDVVRVDRGHGAGPVRIDVREGLLAGPDAEMVDRILIDDVRLRPCLVRKKKVQAPVFVRDVLRAAAHLQLVDDVRGRHVVALQFIDAFAGAELELGAEDVRFLAVTDQVFRPGLIRIDRQRKVVFLRKALCDGKAIVAVAEGKGLRFRVFRHVAHFEHTRRPVVGRQDQDGHEPTKIAGQRIGPKIRVRQVRIDVHVIG